MHCQHCQYPLWHLSARRCPECATPFSLRDFHFRKNSITIRCPHCAAGSPAPINPADLDQSELTCPHCHGMFDPDAAACEPVDGAAPPVPREGELPWQPENEKGVGWWASIKMSFDRPDLLALGGVRRGSPSLAFSFLLTNVLIGTVPTLLVAMFFAGRNVGGAALLAGMLSAGGLLLLPVLWAAVSHLLVAASGAHRGGFSATWVAFAYTSGAVLFLWLPCAGLLLVPLIWASLAAVALAGVHGISLPRASAITFAPVVLFVLVWIVMIVATAR